MMVAGHPEPVRVDCAEDGPLRVALLADTHGFLDPRIAELVSHCDIAVHAGDVGHADILHQLRPRRGVVVAVAGNNDASDTPGLPRVACVGLPGGDLMIEHGDRFPARRRHERLRQAWSKARAVVCGHSHRLMCDVSAAPIILNPGAAGRTRTYGGPSCLLLRASADDWATSERRFPVRPARG